METLDHATLLASIRDQRAHQPLSIVNLAEPILAGQQQQQQQAHSDTLAQTRNRPNGEDHNDSSASATTSTASTSLNPATLAADLQHYRDLFSKLRFSYLEQVTKEKYLRAIVGDPPVLVTPDQNAALEDRLAQMKAELKAKKVQNEALVVEMERLAQQLAETYEGVDVGMQRLEVLPSEIEELEEQVKELRELVLDKEQEMDVDDGSIGDRSDPRMNMSLAETEMEVEEQRKRIKEVDEQIAAMQGKLPSKMRECEKADRELEELEVKRNEVTKLVRDMQRAREEGKRDRLEDRGRWLRGEDAVLRGLLGIDVGS